MIAENGKLVEVNLVWGPGVWGSIWKTLKIDTGKTAEQVMAEISMEYGVSVEIYQTMRTG